MSHAPGTGGHRAQEHCVAYKASRLPPNSAAAPSLVWTTRWAGVGSVCCVWRQAARPFLAQCCPPMLWANPISLLRQASATLPWAQSDTFLQKAVMFPCLTAPSQPHNSYKTASKWTTLSVT